MFIKENLNPKNRKTTDCVTRAVAKACGVEWIAALQMQCDSAKKTGYAMDSNEVIDDILHTHGFCKIKLGRPEAGSKRPTVSCIAEVTNLMNQVAVCHTSGHLTVCVRGNVYDTWDCSDKAVYTYWVKDIVLNQI